MDEREVQAAGPSGAEPGSRGRRKLVLVAVGCVLLVVIADLGYSRWRASRVVGDGDLVFVVRQAHVVDVLAPGMTVARVDVTVENPTSTPVTVTAASFGGFAQPVTVRVPAGGSAPLALRVEVPCDSGSRSPPLSTAATLTVAPPDGAARVVTVLVVESGTADQLRRECLQKVNGT